MPTVSCDGGQQMMLMDVTTGEIAPLDDAPRDDTFWPGAPQWATNDTVLLERSDGPLLIALALAG